MTAEKRDAFLARIQPTASDADLEGCDLIIEAVFEDRNLKAKVNAAAEAAALPDAVVASNTSTLPITGLATAVQRPDKFIGLHRRPCRRRCRWWKSSARKDQRRDSGARLRLRSPDQEDPNRGQGTPWASTSRVFATFINEGIAMLGEGGERGDDRERGAQRGYAGGAAGDLR